jgi:hypothetical protein
MKHFAYRVTASVVSRIVKQILHLLWSVVQNYVE